MVFWKRRRKRRRCSGRLDDDKDDEKQRRVVVVVVAAKFARAVVVVVVISRERGCRSWLVLVLLLLLLCGAQWSFYPKIRDGCFNGGEILSIHRVVLSLCVVVSPPRATQKRVLSSGLDVVYVVVKGAAKKSRLQQKTVVKVVVVGRRRVRAHLGVLLCVSFFLSLFRVSDRVVVVPSAVFSEEKRAFVRWCWWC